MAPTAPQVSPPVHVVVDDAGAAAVVSWLEQQGWVVAPLEVRPPAGGPVVCAGEVVDQADAATVVARVVEGHGMVIRITATASVTVPLLDDLCHLGEVVFHNAGAPEISLRPGLDADTRLLVRLLAGGATLSAAAAEAGLSRRTATRRVAELRRQLGVSTTAQAVVAARALVDRGEGAWSASRAQDSP